MAAGDEQGGAPGGARLLFVCAENSCRSQMAEGFARSLGGDRVEAWSAGSRPSGVVDARAIEAMREVGVDLSSHRSKSLGEVPEVRYDLVVGMGCGDACPLVPAERREDWDVPDPKGLDAAGFRRVRDEIRERVRRLLEEL